jgi:DNA repair ATPase RecN
MLQPAYSIWLLDSALKHTDPNPIHRYKWRDESSQALAEHGGIWVIELKKCHWPQVVNEEQRWLKLFKEGQMLDDVNLPDWMQTPEMRKVMTVLQQFSDKEENYHTYASRLDYQRTQLTIEHWAKESLDQLTRAKQELDQIEHKLTDTEHKLTDAEHKLTDTEHKLTDTEHKLSDAEHKLSDTERELQEALAEIQRLKAGQG